MPCAPIRRNASTFLSIKAANALLLICCIPTRRASLRQTSPCSIAASNCCSCTCSRRSASSGPMCAQIFRLAAGGCVRSNTFGRGAQASASRCFQPTRSSLRCRRARNCCTAQPTTMARARHAHDRSRCARGGREASGWITFQQHGSAPSSEARSCVASGCTTTFAWRTDTTTTRRLRSTAST